MDEGTNNKKTLYLGVINALLTAFFIASMNLFGKLLGDNHNAVEITFYRNLIALFLLLVGLVLFRKLYLLKTQRPFAQFIRALVGTAGMVMSIWTYILLPMAEATTLVFTAPLFVVIMSYPFLGERVGLWRSLSVMTGFIGVLVLIDFDGDYNMIGLLIGLLAGLFNAGVAICLRWLGSSENASTTVFYFLFYGLVGTGLCLPFIGTIPSEGDYIYISAIGVVGLAGLLVKTQAYRQGSAATISAISYTMIIWAALFDYVIWAMLPRVEVFIGAFIIIASNLFILWRETRKTQQTTS